MKGIGCFLLCLFSVNSLFGQARTDCNDSIFEDKLLEKIIGDWIANGQVTGENVVYHFSASFQLNHQFIVLDFADTTKRPKYAAKVFIGYDCPGRKYVVHWLDVFGGPFSETLGYGERTGDTIKLHFEYPEGPFLTKFIYDRKKDYWRFHSTMQQPNGEWVTFGDIYLRRK